MQDQDIGQFVDNATRACTDLWLKNTGSELNANAIYELKSTLRTFFNAHKQQLTAETVGT